MWVHSTQSRRKRRAFFLSFVFEWALLGCFPPCSVAAFSFPSPARGSDDIPATTFEPQHPFEFGEMVVGRARREMLEEEKNQHHDEEHKPIAVHSQQWIRMSHDVMSGESVFDYNGLMVCASDDASVVAVGANLVHHTRRNGQHYADNDSASSSMRRTTTTTTTTPGAALPLQEVRVYKLQGGEWRRLGQSIEGDVPKNVASSGYAMSLSGDGSVLALGTRFYGEESSGLVRVFRYSTQDNRWVRMGQDIHGNEYDESGCSVSLSGDGRVMSVGAVFGGHTFGAGEVRVFSFDSAKQRWRLLGNTMEGAFAGERFGARTTLSRDGLTVTSGDDRMNGSTRIHRYNARTQLWDQVSVIAMKNNYVLDATSLSDDGSVVAIGATNNGENDGVVRVYRDKQPMGQSIRIQDIRSTHVSLSGDGQRLAIGVDKNEEILDDGGLPASAVVVYHFFKQSQTWELVGDGVQSDTYQSSNNSVALSRNGKSFVVGSSWQTETTSSSGRVNVYHSR